MPTFPRTLLPRRATIPDVPIGLASFAESGGAQLRATQQVGRVWEEEWPDLRLGNANVDAFLAWLEWAQSTMAVFDVTHTAMPGSGIAPNGVGGGSPAVAGASQTGSTLDVDGLPLSTDKVFAGGDVIKIAGLTPIYRIRDDVASDGSGAATLTITPAIPVGSSPADGAVITTSGCTIRAIIWPHITFPMGRPGIFIRGLKVPFREVP